MSLYLAVKSTYAAVVARCRQGNLADDITLAARSSKPNLAHAALTEIRPRDTPGPWSLSLNSERARRVVWATELRCWLEAQLAPREGNPLDVKSLCPLRDVDEQLRRTLGDVAALASHGFDEGDEGWCLPLLADLEMLSGDAEISLYRVLMYGIFLAADFANPGRSFKSVFGDSLRGWSLSLPSDAAQRARSLANLKWLFESLVNNDPETAEHTMLRHLEGVKRVPHGTGRPRPSRAFPMSYLLYYGRLEGPE